MFAITSNIQIAEDRRSFADGLDSVVKELADVHRCQIQQKLQGGKLQIHTEEVAAPGLCLLTAWTGAALGPRQLARLGPKAAEIQRQVEEQFMVLPRQDILLGGPGGSIQDEKKLLAARVARNFLKRLERVPAAMAKPTPSPSGRMPIWIGNTVTAEPAGGAPWEFPLDRCGHVGLSGRTGSGKSYAASVLVEGVTAFEDLAILVLDPRNQWVGLLCPENRPEILDRYGAFCLEPGQARSFGFEFHGVGQALGRPLPDDLGRLAREGRKYGIVQLLISQSSMDLSYGLASVRQNIGTRVILSVSTRPSRPPAGFNNARPAGLQLIQRFTRSRQAKTSPPARPGKHQMWGKNRCASPTICAGMASNPRRVRAAQEHAYRDGRRSTPEPDEPAKPPEPILGKAGHG